jgi:hypothetical protein
MSNINKPTMDIDGFTPSQEMITFFANLAQLGQQQRSDFQTTEDPHTLNGPDRVDAPGQNSYTLPWYHADKFNAWTADNGTVRVSPNPDFMAFVKKTSQEILEHGERFYDDDETKARATALRKNLVEVVSMLKLLGDDEEHFKSGKSLPPSYVYTLEQLLARYLFNAATAEFEATCWAQREASKGNNPAETLAENESFQSKGARMERYSICAVALHGALKNAVPNSKTDYAARTVGLCYDEANRVRNQVSKPEEQAAKPVDAASVKLAVQLLGKRRAA